MSINYVPEIDKVSSDYYLACHYFPGWNVHPNGYSGMADIVDFPERTPLIGYYDESNPEVLDWEIKWALEHGVNCFIYCWYRKLDNMGKPVTVDDLRCPHGIHEALFRARYGDMMKFAIMFENSPRWGTTDANDLIENLMPFWCENYFKRDNYLKIDNKPVLFIWNQPRLSGVFGDPKEQKAAFDACREYAVKMGFDGMIFGCADASVSRESFEDEMKRGYDFIFGYDSGYYPKEDYPPERESIEGQLSVLDSRLAIDPMRHIATASCFRDSTPRFSKRWIDQGYEFYKEKRWYISPSGFREVIRRMKERTDSLPDGAYAKKIIMIDNWNEWDEGHFIAPSHKFGFGFLQAIREELTERDNLPDYRTPSDMGLVNYNKSWSIPDFSEFKY